MLIYFQRNTFLSLFILCGLLLSLSACQATYQQATDNAKLEEKSTQPIYKDSTHYFFKRKASISMRATLSNSLTDDQLITEGYKLQFRTLRRQSITITDASIVSGGQRFTISNNEFFVSPQKAITLQLTLETTKLIHQKTDSILRFKADGESLLFRISNHQLQPFLP